MDYASFKSHLTAFLWKPSDQVLLANLDNLISMGNAALNRDLKVQERQASSALTLNSLTVALPSDYFSLRSVECSDTALAIKDFTYVSPAEMTALSRKWLDAEWLPYYSIRGTSLIFSGPAATAPTTAVVEYNAKVPDYSVTDTSWLADNYLDLYTYGVLKHSALFIREDERIPVWNNAYGEALLSCNEIGERYQKRGRSSSMQLPRNPNATRRR